MKLQIERKITQDIEIDEETLEKSTNINDYFNICTNVLTEIYADVYDFLSEKCLKDVFHINLKNIKPKNKLDFRSAVEVVFDEITLEEFYEYCSIPVAFRRALGDYIVDWLNDKNNAYLLESNLNIVNEEIVIKNYF